jgi:hypothetical protein
MRRPGAHVTRDDDDAPTRLLLAEKERKGVVH